MLDFAIQKCKENNVELLYLTKFGSHLYGTATENSDEDFRGIFLPSLSSCILNKQPESVHFSTSDNNTRNGPNDVDFGLWSIQKFYALLSKGDTVAIDLLFSITNENAVIYNSLHKDFFNCKKLLQLKKNKAFLGYCYQQAKKYGLKGSRLSVLSKLVEKFRHIDEDSRLLDYADDFVQAINAENLCFIKNSMLIVNGKAHQLNIRTGEFKERIEREWKIYGHRARMAEANEGIDWKAVSHAFRILYQAKNLYLHGELKFPLPSDAIEFILKIKHGQLEWKVCNDLLASQIEEIEELSEKGPFADLSFDHNYAEQMILKLYK